MKNRNYKKILAIVIASSAIVTTAVSVPVISKIQSAKADTETTTTQQSTTSSDGNTQNQPPQMQTGSDGTMTPPEKPDGDSSNSQTPPEKPDGDNSNGGPGGNGQEAPGPSQATAM